MNDATWFDVCDVSEMITECDLNASDIGFDTDTYTLTNEKYLAIISFVSRLTLIPSTEYQATSY